MPTPSTVARGRYVSLTRSRESDDPELQAAYVLMKQENKVHKIKKLIGEDPTLTATQCARLVEAIEAAWPSD